jgi:two-component system nitrate/nitrite response regulator NarL
MEDRLSVAVVDDHARLVGVLRAATRCSRVRILGPYTPVDRLLQGGADVIVVDLDRDDGHGLATLVRVCDTVRDVRVVAATAERDPELGSAIVTAGASGLLPSRGDLEEIEDGLRRAVAGELVLPDEHLTSLVDRLRIAPEKRPATASVASLTARELQVLHSLSYGQSTAEIAALLGISRMTVQSHVKNVLTKLGVHSKVEAVRLAWRCGAIAMPATA